MLTWIAAQIVQHFPTALGWAASIAAKVLAEKAKGILKKRSQLRAYQKAVSASLKRFGRLRPDLAASFFDQHFLALTISEEMLKLLTRSGHPDALKISDAYAAQFPHGSQVDLTSAVETFLTICEEEFSLHQELQTLLTDRQVQESVIILRRMNQRPEPAPSELEASTILDRFAVASQPLLRWPQTLQTCEWIDRPELRDLINTLEGEGSTSLLLGLPGSGKSALLSRLSSDAIARGWAVLAIKADQVPETVATIKDLQTFLELPAPVVDCLKASAGVKKTILVIDQLDALSELLDLKTQRLQVLLRLLTEARRVNGVHIVASCRSFDRTYDSRLNSIEAEELTLELPAWDQVQDALKGAGLQADQWPQGFREILRVPQCLKLFLQHFAGPDEQRVFESYQAMLEHLWSTRLLGASATPGAADLLLDIATEMAEREVMFVPAAKFDSRRQALDFTVESGFLQYDLSGRQITFTHQTIFDFSHARAFISKEQSLSSYVLARQGGLHVRPKLWSALNYLRGSDIGRYEAELRAIWIADPLKQHVRMLLIDFLGLQEAPSAVEIQLLRPMFTDNTFAAHAFAAVAGRQAWFDVLDRGALSRAMTEDGMSWPAHRVLELAWPFAASRVLQLIEEHWVSRGKWAVAWQTLRSTTSWTREVLEMALKVIRNGDLHASAVHDLATLASAQAPDLAVELVAAFVERTIREAMESRPAAAPPPDDQTYKQALIAHIDKQNNDKLRKIIEDSNDWYELPAVAEAAPKAFLRTVWPPVRAALEVLAREGSGPLFVYQPDHLSATRFEVDSDLRSREHPFMDAFVYAAQALGRQDPHSLREFVEANQASESATVQRLLALGLCEAARNLPEFALEFLLADVRRLSLENFHEDERETKMLIRALAPYLDDMQFSSLEKYILRADLYAVAAAGKSAEDRRLLSKYNRQFRLRLLLQLPKERLAQDTRSLVESELRLFPSFKDDRRVVEVYASGSAMTTESMIKARPKTISGFLSSAPDSTEWGDHDFLRRKGAGGSIQASRAFAEFAKTDTAKALLVIRTLDPKTQQRPAAYAIGALDRENLDDSDLVALIRELDAKGFDGQEFRENSANALRGRVVNEHGLPEDALVLLEKWLGEYAAERDEAEIQESVESKEERTSVIWGRDGFHVLPHGPYPVLNAWFYGLLARAEIDSNRILSGLEQRLGKGDSVQIWRAMTDDALTKLRFLNHSDAAAFLDKLFAAYPQLLSERSGQLLVAHSIKWAPPQLTAVWTDSVRGSGTSGRQAYGELVTLRNVITDGDEWSSSSLLSLLQSPDSSPELDELIGAIYAAANLWKEGRRLSTLSNLLRRGMNATSKDAAIAAMEWFSRVDEVRADVNSLPVLEAFAGGSALNLTQPGTNVLDRLADVLDDAPGLVGKVSQRLLDRFKSEIGNLASGAALQSEALLSLALTLQRHEEPHRSVGLDLFEQLLRYEAYRARDVLRDIDRRPGTAVAPTQLRARRRRRARASRHLPS